MDRFFRWVIAASVFEIGLEGDVILDCEAMFLSGIMILPVQSILFIWVILQYQIVWGVISSYR